MSLIACAALVERADPERFRAIMAAPPKARAVLFPLYAFNVEVVRAPWLTAESMIAEMRLQWWRDALEEIAGGGTVRRHEVVDALAAVLDPEGARLLDGLIAARRWDIYSEPFEDAEHFADYVDATTGHLMRTAARLLGQADDGVVRDFAHAVGVANVLRASAVLRERGRRPFVDDAENAIAATASAAMARMDRARAARRGVSRESGAALLIGHAARPILRQAARDPGAVLAGQLELTPFAQSRRLAWTSLWGWWA
jgi:phytoene/squalene synthetase